MPPRDLSGALRTVLNILDAWEVSIPDRLKLLGCDLGTYHRWTNTRKLGDIYPDTLERLSYLLGIWKALKILFPDSAVADSWIHRANDAPEFNGQTPLVIMKLGHVEGLSRVRRYLDNWCD